jgi:hypothetical protein
MHEGPWAMSREHLVKLAVPLDETRKVMIMPNAIWAGVPIDEFI